MKKINTNETRSANINDLRTIEDCLFVKEINKRYGFKIQQLILICDELKLKNEGWPQSSLYHLSAVRPDNLLPCHVDVTLLRYINVDSIEEFYKVTNTGTYSKEHRVNQNIKDCESIKRLIPIILICYKRKTLAFQLNNQIVREFFDDTELLMGNPLSDEERSLIDRRFLEHKEYLKYFFAPFKNKLNSEMWIKIYYDKLNSNNGNLLHSEYLKRRNSDQKGFMEEIIPMCFMVKPR